mmetsp:Transcript_18125/g.27432  ORF Transcript_18125/g.27432 Transcript_18125/m.27432 type:complete len:508 (-) Transcript_18125:278-1801(-)|eukprot:CAMPEP_0178912560 /NCGR_PEP_ID=MMETSP0786-20121207/10337_1 /TAXON_ID=186022 /ORGANISM="Thalassionema frauenfeldii, Strain CCMP 1798" /LENGTH=507 /DNA_ID=CAMNT_0020585169 /DNA_START=300 /DNA_END=1823 /DNA_ORIENTATION=-
MMNESNQQAKPSRPPLRRAVYVHISDLTSAYNIDHKKLEEELSRVQVESDPTNASVVPAPDDASVASISQKRLQPPRAGFNLCVLVGKVNIVVDKLRVDRSRVRLAEVQVGDETGTVSLRARDDQIALLEEISERSGAAVLRNCTLELFQGRHIRLAVTKWGKMSAFPDDVPSTPPPPSKINHERNFSLIDLSLVASEMVENQPPPEPSYQTTNRDSQSERNRSGGNRYSLQPSQTTHQQRRTQRRQARQKANKPQAIPFPDIPITDQLSYPSSMQGYGYGDAMELQQFYGGIPLSQHHRSLLQHQQYEMQQRQMQQIQAFHDHQHQQQSDQHRSPLLRPMQTTQVLVPSSSFESGQTQEFPSLPSIVPVHDNRHRKESSSNTSSAQAPPDTGPWRGKVPDTAREEAGRNSGSMNPQATVYAPPYVKTQGGQVIHSQQFQGYNPYEQRSRPFAQQSLPTMYTQNIVYVPVPEAASATIVPDQHHQQVIDQVSDKKTGKGKQGTKYNC